MNELYFSGEVFKSDGLEDVIRFWESRNDSYTSEYIKSMLQSVFKEHNMCKVLLGNED